MKKTNIIIGVAVTAAIAATIIGLFVCKYKPTVVANPNYCSFFRADGLAKKAFDTPVKANVQALKQLIQHSEICTPYQVGEKFFSWP